MSLLTDRKPAVALGAAAAALGLSATAWTVGARRQQRESARLHRTLVELLLNALSSGDPVTARHSFRVANLADVLAGQLRMSRGEHATLRVAALLHDLGKIEDDIFPLLHSASPLSEEERERINQHPRGSAHILEPLEPFHPGIMSIVSSHHECWNGAGYPDGRSGEEIPLAARIISVADVFDAMTQPRPYHDPLDIDEALEEIRSGAGQRFDPRVAALLEGPEVIERWTEIALRGREEEEAADRLKPAPRRGTSGRSGARRRSSRSG